MKMLQCMLYIPEYSYTIAIGSGWNKYSLICIGSSENDYEGLFDTISEPSDLSTILTNLEAITCPRLVTPIHSMFMALFLFFFKIPSDIDVSSVHTR